MVRGRGRPEGHRARDDGARLAHGLLGVASGGDRPLSERDEQAPGVRQHEPAVRAHEQRHAEPLLEPPQLLGEARL